MYTPLAKKLPETSSEFLPPQAVAAAGTNARFAWDEFLASLSNHHTRRAYAAAVKRLLCSSSIASVGGLCCIPPSEIARHIEQLTHYRTGLPCSTALRKRHLAAIRSFFDFCVLRHAVALNPAASVRGPRLAPDVGSTVPLPHADALRLLRNLDMLQQSLPAPLALLVHRDKAIIATLTFTAARVGAIASLRRSNFRNTPEPVLVLREKNSRLRNIPCNRPLARILMEYLREVGPTDPYAPMFPRHLSTASTRTEHRAQQPLTARGILRMVRRRLKEAGIDAPGVGCHSFRAGAATHLLEQGIDLTAVQNLLGHRDPRVTRRYDHRGRLIATSTVDRLAG
jgi:integrase/recombinase XerD